MEVWCVCVCVVAVCVCGGGGVVDVGRGGKRVWGVCTGRLRAGGDPGLALLLGYLLCYQGCYSRYTVGCIHAWYPHACLIRLGGCPSLS